MERLLNNLGVTLVAHKLNNAQNDEEVLKMYTMNNSAQSTYAPIGLYQQAELHNRRREYQQAYNLYAKTLPILTSLPSPALAFISNIRTTLALVEAKMETNSGGEVCRRRTLDF